jgi:hypothetical protein
MPLLRRDNPAHGVLVVAMVRVGVMGLVVAWSCADGWPVRERSGSTCELGRVECAVASRR